MDLEPYVEPIVKLITSQTKAIIILFLVLSVIFTAGLGNISTESGTEQFTTDLPSEKALQEINQEFTPRFTIDKETNTGSTQLIQASTNVLSKQSLLRMLELLYELEQNEDLRVVSTSSVAQIVATSIDPSAQTLRKQIYVIEQTPASQIRSTLRSTNEQFPLAGLLSKDYNEGSMTASSTIGVVIHSLPSSAQSAQQSSGTSGTDPLTDIQVSVQEVATIGGDVRVFGSGIFSSEFGSVIGDTMIIVTLSLIHI